MGTLLTTAVGSFRARTLLAVPEEIHTLPGKGMQRSPKATFELVPKCEGGSFNVREFKLPAFSSPWHFHPEYELTYIVNGSGSRFVGERINAAHPNVFLNLTGRIDHEEMTRNEVSFFDRKSPDRTADQHYSTHSII